jgi:hypothetical protein
MRIRLALCLEPREKHLWTRPDTLKRTIATPEAGRNGLTSANMRPELASKAANGDIDPVTLSGAGVGVGYRGWLGSYAESG